MTAKRPPLDDPPFDGQFSFDAAIQVVPEPVETATLTIRLAGTALAFRPSLTRAPASR